MKQRILTLTLCMGAWLAGDFTSYAADVAAPKPEAKAEAKAEAKSDPKKTSYALGMQYGNFVKQNGIDLDMAEFSKAITDTVAGKPALSEQQAGEIMNAYRTEMMAKRAIKQKEAGEKNEKEGKAFLEANAKKDGIKTTASGLQYKVIKEGTGAKPSATDQVKTHYRGTLIDGTEFDSSYSRNEPATFPVNGVIAGWTEALQLMPEGSKWQLFIPSNLAYKERGSGPKIGPNATLIFDIELLAVTKPEAPKPVTSDIIKVPSADEIKKGAKIEVIKDVDAEIKKQKAASEPKPK